MRHLRLAVIAIALLSLASVSFASFAMSASAAAPGVVANDGLSPQNDAQIARLGVGWVRAFVPWNTFQVVPSELNRPQVQALETGLAGLPPATKVILEVVGTPQWESGSSDSSTPPRNPADYAKFIGTMAKRFAGRVAAWEIWNEEDSPSWWKGGPDPDGYTTLLRAAYAAVKAADPRATVVLGGLTGNDYDFLSALYDHGAKGYFDAVGLHTDTICNVISPYEYLRNGFQGGRYDPRINRWAFLGYRTVHEVMLAHSDPSPIWMTELGWSTYGSVCNSGAWAGQKAGGVSLQQQARFLTQAYHCLAQDPYVQVGIWYGLNDVAPYDGPRSFYGLFDSGSTVKPAFGALAEYAHNGDRLTEPCGNFAGPSIKLARPLRGVHYKNILPIKVRASDVFGVHQISLYHDGKIIRNFTSKPPVTTLRGSMTWYGARLIGKGRHLLTVTAIDAKGNMSSASVVIYHGAERRARHRHKHRRR